MDEDGKSGLEEEGGVLRLDAGGNSRLGDEDGALRLDEEDGILLFEDQDGALCDDAGGDLRRGELCDRLWEFGADLLDPLLRFPLPKSFFTLAPRLTH